MTLGRSSLASLGEASSLFCFFEAQEFRSSRNGQIKNSNISNLFISSLVFSGYYNLKIGLGELYCNVLQYIYYSMAEKTKKVSTTVYLTEEQVSALKELHNRTRVPIAEYIRMGIDMILQKHSDNLPGQVSLFDDVSPQMLGLGKKPRES